MIHVEDLLFTGSSKFWVETFLPAMTSKFNVGHHELKNDGTEISFLKRRLVKSSAESELHSMVSGCSDAIFIRRCLEFLSCSMVTHQQWTDNSAAQMLVSRQGVGRIRHLSRKWIQTLVLQQEVSVGQVPTAWKYSDIGTKRLARNRLLVLLNQLGAGDPDILHMVGQDEYEIAVARMQGQPSLRRLAKAVFRMAAIWGLESGFHVGAGNFWLWLAMFFMLALVVGLAVKGYFMLRQTLTDLSHCWNQVADEDSYIATQEGRIDILIRKCESPENRFEQILAESKDEIQTVSNEVSMTHDCPSCLQYAIVEHGG